ncbi:MAG TPA: HAMP domain-containing histidine kinase [Candidatus Eisenbergiella merdipullorum]|uniref:histidine kinase n=1 Tax=Candidatus Eisenbergiella merdipullorum TaxID=2838553 RepID=A0A9D2I5D1_9FIRM|nr:HAMP domain-containing histidine kinase [Candidatus Eisenbergiella merdipullorum]
MKEISRLRRKFIIYNMLIVTAVIGITFTALVSVLQNRRNEESRLILERAVEQPGERLIFDAAPQVRIPYFSVLVTESGEVVMREGAYNSFPGAGYLEHLALLGMAAEADDGILDGYQLRYLRVEQPAGHLLIFADTSYGDTFRDALIRYGGLACAAIWLVFLGLSFLFSRWAVRPIARSLRLQKQFVADASHELKTPLTVITANAELLRERCAGLPEEAERWLANIHQECRDMRALVENLLLLAKGDIGTKQKESREIFSFSDLLTEKLLVFEPLFFQAGKELRYEVADDVFVKGDASQLAQLVKVLLDNAVKYASGTGRVEVRLAPSGHGRARLWVNSEGEAIPKEKRPMIFQRFYRDERVRASCAGYGLGLAIANEIAANHHASIGVEYREGMNCFYVNLRTCCAEKRAVIAGNAP